MPARKNEIIFLSITLILLFCGFFILASASLGLAAKSDKNSYSPLIKQIFMGGGVGALFFLITSRINYKRWRKLVLPFFLLSLFLTLIVFYPSIGVKHGGSTRWLSLGPITFQPSELLKFAFIVYLASWLARRKNEVSSFARGFLPFLVLVGLVAIALIRQPDVGTLGIISITSAILFFLAGGKYSQIGLLIILGIGAIIILSMVRPYMTSRILVFLDNSYDLQGAGYQLNQAKIAIGSGGIFGKGFGEGLAKFNSLPEPVGDSIFAVVGEEFGFIGTVSLIFLFFLFFYRAIKIALKTNDIFGRLLVSGIAILIIVQVFVNIYAIVGLIPLTGVPLPFISQGGTALSIALAEIGVIVNVAKKS